MGAISCFIREASLAPNYTLYVEHEFIYAEILHQQSETRKEGRPAE